VTLKSNTEKPGIKHRLSASLNGDTVLGAVLLVLAPFGIWKLYEIVSWHLS
jgi:hypothetical protein